MLFISGSSIGSGKARYDIPLRPGAAVETGLAMTRATREKNIRSSNEVKR